MNKIILTAAVVLLSACMAKNPDLTGLPKPPPAAIARATVEQVGDGLEVKVDPRVDILFVIDDSASMKNHQMNLSRNVHRFVEAIAKNKTIDFHIGYTVAHDFKRYGVAGGVPAVCGANTTTPGRVNFEEPGTLKQLEGPADKLPKDGRRFVTREDDFQTLLAATLDPNTPNRKVDLVKTFVAADPSKPEVCAYGPEEEAMFSPLLGAIEDESRAVGPNKGFRRPGAFFVAIIVSDAKDASVQINGTPVTPDDVVKRLTKVLGGQKLNKQAFRIYSVAMKPGQTITKECKPDPAWADRNQRPDGQFYNVQRYGQVIGKDENPLANLASLTSDKRDHSQTLSICEKNYGESLAAFGNQVQKDTLKDIEVELPTYVQTFPAGDKRNLSVLIGNTELARDSGLWKYDVNSATVTIAGEKVDWNKFPNAKIRVRYIPADTTSKDTKLFEEQQK